MPGMEGNPGISIPRIGGRDIPPLPPPSIEDMLLADPWMLWAASPSPAPATPIARALNSANLLSRPAPMLSFRSAKKGSEKKADLFDSSSCFSDILRLCCQGCTRKEGHKA